MFMKIIMLGAPGAGKGTQAKKIAEKYSIPHISTGDIFRANIKNGTELGMKAKTYMDQGLLVPDELVVDLVVDRLAQDDCANGCVLDGFPRTLPQAEALDQIIAKTGESVTATVSIMIPDAMIMERIKGRALKEGRADDASEDIINNRIETYHNQTEPLIEYYTKAEKYHEIDGIGTIEEVRDRIFSVMDKF